MDNVVSFLDIEESNYNILSVFSAEKKSIYEQVVGENLSKS